LQREEEEKTIENTEKRNIAELRESFSNDILIHFKFILSTFCYLQVCGGGGGIGCDKMT
jgi:hypothetical protein